MWSVAAIVVCLPLTVLADGIEGSANLGGGWTFPAGHSSGNFNSGWNFAAGVGIKPGPVSFNLNFLFEHLGVTESALAQTAALNPTSVGLLQATSAHAKFYSLTLDPTVRVVHAEKADVYAFGGFGWLRRSLQFTGPSTTGPLLEPVGTTVFGSGGDSGGFDFGAGVNYRLRKRGPAVYGEVRFIHGISSNSSTILVPLSFGVRW
jgi:hypothetical protein